MMIANRRRVMNVGGKDKIILPEEYQECEYIQRDIDDQPYPYINSGVNISSELRIVAKISNSLPASSDKYPNAFGARDGNITYRYECFGTIAYVHNFSVTGSTFDTSYRTTDTSPHTIDLTKERLIYDGVTYPSSSSSTWSSDKKLFIGSMNMNNTAVAKGSNMKIYYFKIYDGATLVRNFIPAYKSSNPLMSRYGLYDTINNVFYLPDNGAFTGSIKS